MLVDGRVTYVPIGYRPRLGRAKAPTWRHGFRALFAIVGIARRYNPVVVYGLVAAAALIPAVGLLGYATYLFLVHGAYHDGYFLTRLMLFVIGGAGADGRDDRVHAQKDGTQAHRQGSIGQVR